MAETARDSKIKLTIKFHSSSRTPKEYVLCVPRSKKRELSDPSSSSSDLRCRKRCKVVASEDLAKATSKTDSEYSSVTRVETTSAMIVKDSRTVDEEVAETKKVATDHDVSVYPIKIGGTTGKCGVVKEKWRVGNATVCEEKEKKKEPLMRRRVVKKDSRIIKEGKDCVNNSCSKNMMKKVATAVNTDEVSAVNIRKQSLAVVKNGTTTQYCGIVNEKGRVGCKISRTVREEDCEVKKNEKVQKNARAGLVMDHCKKMQCWVMLKRLMIGRDSWVFKEPLMGFEILDKDYTVENSSMSKFSIKSEIVCNETLKKPTCLKDIESKLNKLLYTNPDEFADDLRVILSYGLLHPPRNDIYKIARRVNEDFEVSWKSLKEKWLSGERKGEKI